jgi:hypothetical protein
MVGANRSFRNQPITIAEIRDSVRKKSYTGDLFEALSFMLTQYDIVNSRLKAYTQPTEYNIVDKNKHFCGDVA